MFEPGVFFTAHDILTISTFPTTVLLRALVVARLLLAVLAHDAGHAAADGGATASISPPVTALGIILVGAQRVQCLSLPGRLGHVAEEEPKHAPRNEQRPEDSAGKLKRDAVAPQCARRNAFFAPFLFFERLITCRVSFKVRRDGIWLRCSALDLLPGDLMSITRGTFFLAHAAFTSSLFWLRRLCHSPPPASHLRHVHSTTRFWQRRGCCAVRLPPLGRVCCA